MRRQRKGQSEILGLAVIVILIVLGMTLYLRFQILEAPTDVRASFTHKSIVNDMLSSLYTTTDPFCNDIRLVRLLQDCATDQTIECVSGQTSCEYAENIISGIFSQTLEQWNVKYDFSVFTDPQNPHISLVNGTCRDKRTSTYSIPTGGGRSVDMVLGIC